MTVSGPEARENTQLRGKKWIENRTAVLWQLSGSKRNYIVKYCDRKSGDLMKEAIVSPSCPHMSGCAGDH